jgi:hypothetical protein
MHVDIVATEMFAIVRGKAHDKIALFLVEGRNWLQSTLDIIARTSLETLARFF